MSGTHFALSLILGGGPRFVRGFSPSFDVGIVTQSVFSMPHFGKSICPGHLLLCFHQFIFDVFCFGGIGRRKSYIVFCYYLMVQKLEIMSLNVNGLGNATKRARVMTKIKKENKHVIFLQETHLSPNEHEKLKKFGYKEICHSSYAAFQATCNSCFSNLIPVKVHWNSSQTRDFPPVNSYLMYSQLRALTSHSPQNHTKQPWQPQRIQCFCNFLCSGSLA